MDKIHEVEMLEKKRKSSLRQTILTIALVLILGIVIEYFSFFADLFGLMGIEVFLKFLLQIIFLGLGMISVCNFLILLTIIHQLDKKRDDIKSSKTLL
ncbi:hypothetical protein P9W99_18005 [Bacillus cereus]|jgi:uncharacterized membrane protein YcjF (UPF0283 family)|uniref:Uncharacterized protein n=2 Tax=Bacillus cereus group TaxID=86661 RepID=A0A9W5VBL4_BACCE|nr:MULTISPECIES: hypothetical protein [Bacillus cereus group]ABD24328.1 hypothetical membrane protein [Bacillus thuringiensis]AHZ55285.1 hypothetical protein YBT1520_33456 [Bacillus thuringiensis serovar kurstaki str. YBT-1520]AIE36946.1 hypothetical protein BTK_34531 [Bacillus thuringiensis serovar kurstaki str. HD-1]AJK38398.1 hypothetical protein BG08_6677 [Bacillus thuringiensis serovar kurstaki]AKJ63244.1 hypothetical protein XI92_34515 [Bacillus thuringiensis]